MSSTYYPDVVAVDVLPKLSEQYVVPVGLPAEVTSAWNEYPAVIIAGLFRPTKGRILKRTSLLVLSPLVTNLIWSMAAAEKAAIMAYEGPYSSGSVSMTDKKTLAAFLDRTFGYGRPYTILFLPKPIVVPELGPADSVVTKIGAGDFIAAVTDIDGEILVFLCRKTDPPSVLVHLDVEASKAGFAVRRVNIQESGDEL